MLKGIGLAAAIAATTVAACSDTPSSQSGSQGSDMSSSGGTSGTSGDATSSSGDAGTSGGATGTTPAEVCVAAINDYRKTKNLPPYARWDAAEACTNDQATSDGTTNKPHGAFGKCGEYGQNECPGWPGQPGTMIAPCLKAMFGEGPGGGHYENMMAKRYTKVSCGFAKASNGRIWAVQNFR
jgi:hypothetical protein